MSKKHEARTEREKADLKEFHEAMEETKTNFKKLLINKDTVWPGMLAVDEVNAKAARLGLGPIMKEERCEDEPNHPLGPLQGQHITFLAPDERLALDERGPVTLTLTWLLDPGDILPPELIEPLLKPGTTRDVIECLQAWQDKAPLPPELIEGGHVSPEKFPAAMRWPADLRERADTAAQEALRKSYDGLTFDSLGPSYNENTLGIPAGLCTDILRGLHKAAGEVVRFKDLYQHSGAHKASSELRRAIAKINAALRKAKAPLQIVNLRSVGYSLQPKT